MPRLQADLPASPNFGNQSLHLGGFACHPGDAYRAHKLRDGEPVSKQPSQHFAHEQRVVFEEDEGLLHACVKGRGSSR